MTEPTIEPAYSVLLGFVALVAIGLAAGLVVTALLLDRLGRHANLILACIGLALVAFWYTTFAPSAFWRSVDGDLRVLLLQGGFVAFGLGIAACARAFAVEQWPTIERDLLGGRRR